MLAFNQFYMTGERSGIIIIKNVIDDQILLDGIFLHSAGLVSDRIVSLS